MGATAAFFRRIVNCCGPMRILALTDMHGSYDRMREMIPATQSADVVVIGGDWTTSGTRDEIKTVIIQAKSSGKPVVAVCGNMDPPQLESELESLGVSINGRGIVIQDVGFFGVSASPISPLHTPNKISEDCQLWSGNPWVLRTYRPGGGGHD